MLWISHIAYQYRAINKNKAEKERNDILFVQISKADAERSRPHYLAPLLEEKAKQDYKTETDFLIAARGSSKALLYWKKIQGEMMKETA